MKAAYDDGLAVFTKKQFIAEYLRISNELLLLQSIDRGVAQLASAHVWGTWGRKFESSHPDQIKPPLQKHRWFFIFLFCIAYFWENFTANVHRSKLP